MTEPSSELSALAANTPFISLLGLMTLAFMLALVLIALGVRFTRILASARAFDEAVEKVQRIEQQLEDMTRSAESMQQAYDRSIADIKDTHAKEIFALQQTIFERNSEILSLKQKNVPT